MLRRVIKLRNKSISYLLKISSRARRMRLEVHRGGRLVVVKPRLMSIPLLESFLRQKTRWILSKIKFLKLAEKDNFLRGRSLDYSQYKEKAQHLIQQRVDYFNRIYKFKFNQIRVKNQKTLWGSCSAKKNLNFNYKLIFLPVNLRDYIIVHELCHLKEMNHSTRFWKLVAQALPNYFELRKIFRQRKFRLI